MRILLLSKEGDGLGVAQRLALEGYAVDAWVKDVRLKRALGGIVNRPSDWRTCLLRADLVLCDCVGLSRFSNDIRRAGKPFISCNEYVDRTEIDRAVGMDMFQRAGVRIPETVQAARPSEVDLPPPWGDGWVIKPCGNASTAKTMVVKDEGSWKACLAKAPPDKPLIVQRVVKGVEVSTEGWFNGKTFLTPFNHTFEEKRFMPGNLGITTGCMGNVVLAAESDKLTRATVEKVAPFLRMAGYRGPFDINCIVNESGAYALEVSGRMGFDAIEAFAELLDEPLGQFLAGVAGGTTTPMALGSDFSIAIRLSIPPWPVQKPDQASFGEPILGITDETLEHLFLTDVYREGGKYFTAAGDGVLLKATARAPSVAGVQRKVYRLLDGIGVDGKQYRTDIGDRVADDLKKLREWGWIGKD